MAATIKVGISACSHLEFSDKRLPTSEIGESIQCPTRLARRPWIPSDGRHGHDFELTMQKKIEKEALSLWHSGNG